MSVSLPSSLPQSKVENFNFANARSANDWTLVKKIAGVVLAIIGAVAIVAGALGAFGVTPAFLLFPMLAAKIGKVWTAIIFIGGGLGAVLGGAHLVRPLNT